MTEETITLVAAIAFTAVGLGAFIHLFLMVNGWPRASGQVVGNEAQLRSSEGADDYAFFPRVAFMAADGKSYEFRGDIGLSEEWPIGQAVRLSYCASDPGKATILKDWQRLLFAGIFMGFAAAFWGAWLGVLS